MNENTYSTGGAESWRDKAVLAARKKIYDAMAAEFPLDELGSIIDVGATADRELESSNFFEKLYPHPERITALSDQDASWLQRDGIQNRTEQNRTEQNRTEHRTEIRFVRGDALRMPFEDNSFDLAFSSAVIEHVGSRENQLQLLRECVRVSKRYVFITTPNRFYPIELHTALPFLHWLPPKIYRASLRAIGKDFFASEDNLNLLSANDLSEMMRGVAHADYSIDHIRFLGLKSNLLLTIRKFQI